MSGYRAHHYFLFGHSYRQLWNKLAQNAAFGDEDGRQPLNFRVPSEKFPHIPSWNLHYQRLAAVLCHTSCILCERIQSLIVRMLNKKMMSGFALVHEHEQQRWDIVPLPERALLRQKRKKQKRQTSLA